MKDKKSKLLEEACKPVKEANIETIIEELLKERRKELEKEESQRSNR
ncbi:MAG: hypothetical protein Q6368_007750 [Candidatus Baldrarchaeota archaeon]